jgi:hypothetical protein
MQPFPITTVLQETEGFTYATALDLIMACYAICLDPDTSKSAPSFFLGANTLIYNYQWPSQHNAVGIPGKDLQRP